VETIHGDQIKEEDAAVPASKFSRLYQLVPFPGRADDMAKVF